MALTDERTTEARLLSETVNAAERERTRVALELHDGPIQHFASAGYILLRVRLRLDRGDQPEQAGEFVDQVRDLLSDEVADLRRLIAALRPPVLDEGGLGPAVDDYVAAFRNPRRHPNRGERRSRPARGGAAQVREVLAVDGVVLLVEHAGSERLEENLNPAGRFFYACSAVVCTPNALADHAGAAPLGTIPGVEALRRVANDAGFSRVRQVEVDAPFNLLLELRP